MRGSFSALDERQKPVCTGNMVLIFLGAAALYCGVNSLARADVRLSWYQATFPIPCWIPLLKENGQMVSLFYTGSRLSGG